MVEITKEYTNDLKSRLENENLSQKKLLQTANNSIRLDFNFENNAFIQKELQNYCNTLIASEPNYIFNDNFKINSLDDESWENMPDVFSGSPETLFTQPMLKRFDKIASDLEEIENNSMYLEKSNFNNEVEQIESIIESNRTALYQDPSLSISEKESLSDALFAAKSLVRPQVELLNVLASHVEIFDNAAGIIETNGQEEVNQSRRRTFFGKLIRAVARVAIAITAVTVATAIIVVGAKVLIPASKFAMKVKAKGVAKSIFKGVGKKETQIRGNGIPNAVYAGKFVTPGSLYFGGIGGVVKSGLKWNDDMSLKKWYKEFDFKTKAKP